MTYVDLFVMPQLTTADGMTALGRLTKTAGLVTLELTVSQTLRFRA
jgi:hypothetical protein